MKCLLLLLVATCHQALALKQAEVTINARGITGTITFTQLEGLCVEIQTSLSGLQGDQGWHVHTLPIDQTLSPDVQCLSPWAGPHYDPTNARANPNYETDCNTGTPENCEFGDLAGRLGPLPANGQFVGMDCTGNIALQGPYSIVGRSVVIHEAVTNDNFECGTILTREELNGAEAIILQSIFVSPVAGRMYFKQVVGLPDVQIWGKLYYVDDRNLSLNHNWHIHRDLPDEDYRVGVCGPAGPHFDPTMADATSEGYDERCTMDTPEMCEIGDLTGKLGIIDVSATPGPYATNSFFFTDTYLNLTELNGAYDVVGRSVVVHVEERGADRLSCAPLVEAERITLNTFVGAAKKDEDSQTSISQYSCYQDTIIDVGDLPSLDVPSDNPDLTIVTAALSPNGPCPLDGDSDSDSTYSPREIVPDVTTPDGFALGDLSGAYGDYFDEPYFSVFDLPVFGARVTVTARTLRYTYGNYRKCSALLPVLQQPTFARASFSGRDVGGNIFFIQDFATDVSTGSTFIIVDIYYNDNTRDQTFTHNWHIHEFASMPEQQCVDVIGGHYNPYGVSLLSGEEGMFSDYSEDCNGNYQLRCESGDMSGKHGQLSIAPGNSLNRPSYTYVDNNLELGGTYTVVGRSVGLHLPTSEGGALFDCATVDTFAKSEIVITSSIPVANFTTKVEFAALVAYVSGIPGVTANDILVVGQKVSPDGCVATSFYVLADTQMRADTYAGMIAEVVEEGELGACGRVSGANLPLLAPLLLLLPLLLSTSLLL